MNNTKVMAFPYSSRCDIYGCSNVAKHSIGNSDASPRTHFNVCEECLEAIVKSIPRETVFKWVDPYAVPNIVITQPDVLDEEPPKEKELKAPGGKK